MQAVLTLDIAAELSLPDIEVTGIGDLMDMPATCYAQVISYFTVAFAVLAIADQPPLSMNPPTLPCCQNTITMPHTFLVDFGVHMQQLAT